MPAPAAADHRSAIDSALVRPCRSNGAVRPSPPNMRHASEHCTSLQLGTLQELLADSLVTGHPTMPELSFEATISSGF